LSFKKALNHSFITITMTTTAAATAMTAATAKTTAIFFEV
jgi:hypothetical protein